MPSLGWTSEAVDLKPRGYPQNTQNGAQFVQEGLTMNLDEAIHEQLWHVHSSVLYVQLFGKLLATSQCLPVHETPAGFAAARGGTPLGGVESTQLIESMPDIFSGVSNFLLCLMICISRLCAGNISRRFHSFVTRCRRAFSLCLPTYLLAQDTLL